MVIPRAIRDGVSLVLAGLALLIAGWLYADSGSDTLRRLSSPDMNVHVDFDTFWRSAAALWAGADIYQTGALYPNLNPPILTVVLAPFGLTDVLTGYHLWVLCTVGLVLGSMAAIACELRVPTVWSLPVSAAILVSAPMLGTLALGQIYGLLIAPLTVCWIAERRGRPVVAGIAMGFAIAIKPVLLPLLLLPLLRGQRGQLAAGVISTAVASAIGVAIAGWSSVPGWLGVLPVSEANPFVGNASIPGTLARLFSSNRDATPIAELPGVMALAFLLGLAVLALTLARVRHRPPDGSPDTAVWGLTAAALLASPIAWNTYLVLLAPAVLVVLAAGRKAQALLLLALPLIGVEWLALWAPRAPGASVPLSLNFVILLCYWLVLLPRTPGRQTKAGPADGPSDESVDRSLAVASSGRA